MKILIVHLSDIHISSERDEVLGKAEAIAKSCFHDAHEACQIFIAVTGDIAFSGRDTEYDLASNFLDEIRSRLIKESGAKVSIIVVPGNHDCNFGAVSRAREILISSIGKGGGGIDSSVIDACTEVQKNFFEFRDLIEDDGCVGDKLWWSKRFNVGGKVVGFECLNMAWMSKKTEEQGAIYFPYELYSERARDAIDIRITLLHHPVNWLSQTAYRPLRKFLREVSNVVITGHEHVGCFGENEDCETDRSAYVEGSALWDGNISNSSFNSIFIDLGEDKYRAVKYVFDFKKGIFSPCSDGSWVDYRDLPGKRKGEFQVTDEFSQLLDDAGGGFRHHAKQKLFLSDFYVFPDLKRVSDGDKREILSSKTLQNIDAINGGVVIEAGEKAGGTRLLYKLFNIYHDLGFVPLILKGGDLRKAEDRHLEGWIFEAVRNQYGDALTVPFQQIEADRKVLFVDDFDDIKIRDKKTRCAVIDYLKKRFRAVVIVVGDMFDLHEMIQVGNGESPLSGFEHFRLQYFGYVLRSKLIQKWYALGGEGVLSDAEAIALCDNAERMIDAVMKKNIIPASPFYLLTLLQSFEAGASTDFKDSSLGRYYEFLLTGSLTSAGLKKDKLNEVYDYCAQLSWFYSKRNVHEISDVEFQDFNKEFSDKWHTVDAGSRLRLLIEAGILKRRGEYLSFKYPYVFHYLKGLYLSKNIGKMEIRDYVIKCCRHLYVRDNANAILFLAHHCPDEFIITAVTQVLGGLFDKYKAVEFNGDTAQISKLIGDAPKLKYTGQSPEKSRERLNKTRDHLDDGLDGLADKEEDGDAISLLAELTVLFKTVEILGQILKNQYSGIERAEKIKLITALIDGPLRSLQKFYKYFEEYPDYLVSEVDAVLAKKHKINDALERKRIANKIVADVIQFTTFGFLMKTARAVSSSALAEDIKSAVEQKGTIAYQLIELAFLLDSPKDIPREKIKYLSGETKGNMISEVIVGMLALHHMYMFKTSDQDKQFLDSVLKLGMGLQRSIDFKTRNTKKIN